jgi:Protein of unknown function (DUF4229)
VKSALLYTLLRLLLLVTVGGLAYAAGMRGLLLIVVAFVVSGLIAVFVLRRPRSDFSGSITGFFSRLNARIDAAARAEDDDEPLAATTVEPTGSAEVDLRPTEPGVTSPSTSADPRTTDSPRSS